MSGKQSKTTAVKGAWWLYMIQCSDGSLYTGVSTDVQRRYNEHNQQGPRTARYLRGRAPLQLVFSVEVGGRGQALKLEYRVKQLSRVEKLQIIANGKLPAMLVTTDEENESVHV